MNVQNRRHKIVGVWGNLEFRVMFLFSRKVGKNLDFTIKIKVHQN